MPFTAEQNAELGKPLDRKHVKPPPRGKHGSYVEGWHVIAEANRIFGFDGWVRETVVMEETNRELLTLKGDNGEYQQWRVGYMAKVRVTAHGVAREGTGFGSGAANPSMLSDAIESAVKEAETDAMKRALMTFGNPFGLALYDKSQASVADAPSEAFERHADAIRSAKDLEALRFAFDVAKADKSLSQREAADLIRVKDDMKSRLTPQKPGKPASTLGEHLDAIEQGVVT